MQRAYAGDLRSERRPSALVVHAAAGNNRYETDGLTGLAASMARRFIVAYPDHLRLSLPVLEEGDPPRARREQMVYR